MGTGGLAAARRGRLHEVMAGYVERVGVTVRRDDLAALSSYGWTGGTGTMAAVDPREDLIGILMTQRLMDSPEPPAAFSDFWTLAHAAIDD